MGGLAWLEGEVSAREHQLSRSLETLFFFQGLAQYEYRVGLPRPDHVRITTDESLELHNNKFDEMPCKPDCTENPRP